MQQLQGRIAIVTGASRGIGYATACALAQQGAHIIALARTIGGLEELDDDIRQLTHNQGATLVPMDLRDFEAIDRLGASIYERWGKLDILIANAGILGVLSPLGHITPKDFEQIMAVNVTANWRLIRALDPLLRQSDAGRAIFVSAAAAHQCKPFWGAYSASKAALEALVKTYAAETVQTPIRVNFIDPGPTHTALRSKALPGEDPSSLKKPKDITSLFIHLSMPDIQQTGVLHKASEQEHYP